MTEIVSFSIQKGMLKKLDIRRDAVARSKFISKLLQNSLDQMDIHNENGNG
jgi:metal-responsive CopG/Arc/MetJ family transcriptional regulator